ncbi:MAG: DUF1549 domain-containing protein [Planctomycetota bacterium]|nr:DUF1549 domain-containing protein [Planctomycetota bacterium]
MYPAYLYILILTCGLIPATANENVIGLAFFEKQIRPVLSKHCYSCHSAEAVKEGKLKANLFLDTRSGIRNGGVTSAAVTPGDVEASLLVKAIRHDSDDLKMPHKGDKLPDKVIEDFIHWIQIGAPDPRDGQFSPPKKMDVAEAREKHWAFQPLQQPVVPQVTNAAWARTPIDAFILRKLEAAGIEPTPAAKAETLLRRVYLDLIGLLPTPAEQKAFLENPSDEAYQKVVVNLLSRPQYGERWARHWLDVVRYAETKGYERDDFKPNVWRYRDWVIRALNDDMPYDRFITEQLAGDEIEGTDASTQTATTFLALGPYDTIAENRNRVFHDTMDDVLGTTASAFLGLTLQCARCHDHKFEPLSQEDYYRFAAAFTPLQTEIGEGRELGTEAEVEVNRQANQIIDQQIAGIKDEMLQWALPTLAEVQKVKTLPNGKAPRINEKDWLTVLEALQIPADKRNSPQAELLKKFQQRILEDTGDAVKGQPTEAEWKAFNDRMVPINATRPKPPKAWRFFEPNSSPKPTHLMVRGDADQPGKEVEFGLPGVLKPVNFTQPESTRKTSGRRLWLANWMSSNGRPLVARVMANRIWQYHFGRGFVENANDLGANGGAPSHPELLDWLANELVQGGWKMKRIHQMIALSSVYRMSASHLQPGSDPDGRLLSRWPLHRLTAEAIRDSILSVSGRLNDKMYGESIHPPFDQMVVGASSQAQWKKSSEEDAARRSVYVFAKRAIPLPDLAILDLADSASSCDRRDVSTTPVQSLLLLNGNLAWEHASHFADRLRKEAENDRQKQIEFAFQIALCRKPTMPEIQAALAFFDGKKESPAPPEKQEQPRWKSPLIQGGSSANVLADIKGAKRLYLVVTDGGNGNGSDWADWVQPKLTGPAGTKKLIELEWTKAYAQWGKVYVGKNANGEPLKVRGKIIQDAIGTHASSVISYDLPPGYERFEALVTNEDGHAGQIQFMVFTEEPDLEELKNTEIPKGSKPIDPLAAFCLVLMNTNEFVYMN